MSCSHACEQASNLVGERRLGEIRRIRCRRKRAVLTGGQEVPQLLERHDAGVMVSASSVVDALPRDGTAFMYQRDVVLASGGGIDVTSVGTMPTTELVRASHLGRFSHKA